MVTALVRVVEPVMLTIGSYIHNICVADLENFLKSEFLLKIQSVMITDLFALEICPKCAQF